MAGRLEGKVAIITGGNSGIGEATVHRFAEEGAKVAVLARREAEGRAVEDAVRAAGGEATFIACDVTQRAQVEAAVQQTVERYGALHVLFNNAGGGFPGEFPRESDDVWTQTLDLNLTGTFRMTKAAWNHLAEAGANGGASIVNMSSFAAVSATSPSQRKQLPYVPPAAYAASKAGVEAFTRYVAAVGAETGVRANVVRPGQITAPSADVDGHHFAEEYFAGIQLVAGPGAGRDVADAVLFLACDESRFITGQALNIDGGAAGKV